MCILKIKLVLMSSRDKDNIPYTLQNWYDGRECDTKSVEDIKKVWKYWQKYINL